MGEMFRRLLIIQYIRHMELQGPGRGLGRMTVKDKAQEGFG